MTTLENLVKTFLVKYINYVYIKLKLMQKLKFKTKFMLENKKFSFPEYIKIKSGQLFNLKSRKAMFFSLKSYLRLKIST